MSISRKYINNLELQGSLLAALLFCLWNIHFIRQTHSDFNALDEPRLFVVPAEGTYGVDDLVDLLQGEYSARDCAP